jgi:hypothetical protein
MHNIPALSGRHDSRPTCADTASSMILMSRITHTGDFDCTNGHTPPPPDSDLPYVGVDTKGAMCICPRVAAKPSPPVWCTRWYFSPLGRAAIQTMPDVSKLIPQVTMPLQNVRFLKDTDFASVIGLTSFDRIAAIFEGVLAIKTVSQSLPPACMHY